MSPRSGALYFIFHKCIKNCTQKGYKNVFNSKLSPAVYGNDLVLLLGIIQNIWVEDLHLFGLKLMMFRLICLHPQARV